MERGSSRDEEFGRHLPGRGRSARTNLSAVDASRPRVELGASLVRSDKWKKETRTCPSTPRTRGSRAQALAMLARPPAAADAADARVALTSMSSACVSPDTVDKVVDVLRACHIRLVIGHGSRNWQSPASLSQTHRSMPSNSAKFELSSAKPDKSPQDCTNKGAAGKAHGSHRRTSRTRQRGRGTARRWRPRQCPRSPSLTRVRAHRARTDEAAHGESGEPPVRRGTGEVEALGGYTSYKFNSPVRRGQSRIPLDVDARRQTSCLEVPLHSLTVV